MEPRKKQRPSLFTCEACKFLRKKCTYDCPLAPHFPADGPLRYPIVHTILGRHNVTKILQNLPELSRADAATTLYLEAEARIKDPVCGCSGEIYRTEKRITELQAEIYRAEKRITELMQRIDILEEKIRKRPNEEG